MGLSQTVLLGRVFWDVTLACRAAATFIGALTSGPLAEVGNYPGVDAVRRRTLERVRAALGDQPTDACVAHGAAMSYDEIVEYALLRLEPA